MGPLRLLSICMGLLTFIGGLLVTPGLMVGFFILHSGIAEPIGIAIAILLVCFVSYLLIRSDRAYRRHCAVICAGVVITAVGGIVLLITPNFLSAFKEASFAASMYQVLASCGGLFLLGDTAVLSIRLYRARKASA